MRLYVLLPMALFLFCSTLACGLFNGGEDEDEDDPEQLDFGSDPDEDGISTDDEREIGTDPTNPDTDGDGFLDGEEVDAGSDPLNRFSWDYDSGRYPDFSNDAVTVVPTGWDFEDIAPDAAFFDQFGNELALHQFYGHVIVLTFTATWCPPCEEAAGRAQRHWFSRREDGLMYIHVLTGNQQDERPSTDDLLDWARASEIEFPVVEDELGDLEDGLTESGVLEGYMPAFVIIDRDMRIHAAFVGGDEDEWALAQAERLLDSSAPTR